ncbi:acyl-CoA dehydrogenase NM domain-like protein [Mycena albidolilacea]|uniref:Acyl-CoA dehydrogenase NM domain-like protein n=1 Tax=Mycena albidolilacea TaxID=1033008 RepID=A0AAD7A8S2_9AGAR|nr:acyl-CoA dehydrogenase NM domain-like protein [Mycena albidolilacea]
MWPTQELVQTPLFQLHNEGLPLNERIALSYKRAKAISDAYRLTAKDLLTLSPKFWQLHTDPIWAVDGAAGTLVTLQYNCCAGTLAMFARTQPEIQPTLKKVLDFDISGQFCLTEVGHGLDVFHLETTATLLPDGGFEINTPHDRAAKYMPPTAPVGVPCVAIVFARTLIRGEDCGIKPFLIELHNGKDMSPGVVCKVLPQRGGSRPVNHSLTYFHNVQVPFSALLGTDAKADDPRTAFFTNISRVAVGTIAIGSLGIPALQVASVIASKYSNRRTVVDAQGVRKSIMSFQTQKIPIMSAVAQSFVMQALHHKCVSLFCNLKLDPRVRHAVASTLKLVMIEHAQTAHLTLGDRCGAQGLFEVNQLTGMHSDMRGTAIAEGDLLGISIRLGTELLLGRYSLPETTDPNSLLAKHELGLFREMRERMSEMEHHRSPEYDQIVLPELVNLVQAVGHRIAYDAAVEAKLEPYLLDMYVASCVKVDLHWYVENLGLTRREYRNMERAAVEAIYPRLDDLLARMNVDAYVTAPFTSDQKWDEYLGTLETFGLPSENLTSQLGSTSFPGHYA